MWLETFFLFQRVNLKTACILKACILLFHSISDTFRLPEISFAGFFLCVKESNPKSSPSALINLEWCYQPPHCRLTGALLLPGLGKKELKVCTGKAAQLPAEAEKDPALSSPVSDGPGSASSRFKWRFRLPSCTLSAHQDELSLGPGWCLFVCRFGALQSTTCLVVCPGWALRVVGTGGARALSLLLRPSAGGYAGEGWQPLLLEHSAHAGRDWGVLGVLPRIGGLWDENGGSKGAQGWMQLR